MTGNGQFLDNNYGFCLNSNILSFKKQEVKVHEKPVSDQQKCQSEENISIEVN